MEFEKIGIEDLLADESFINYCKNSSAEDIEKWERITREHPEYRPLVEQAATDLKNLFSVLADVDYREQEARLVSRLDQGELAPVVPISGFEEKKTKRRFPFFLRVAAAAAIIFFVLFLVNRKDGSTGEGVRTFVSAPGERKNLQLPDGSGVTLNGGSKITIDRNYGLAGRHIYLEGEAFFDVKHNQDLPFIVHTPAMDVKALGTAFNIKAYPSEKATETSLIRGLVEVTLKESDNRKMLLRPNQKVKWLQPLVPDLEKNVSAPIDEKDKPAVHSLTKTQSGVVKEIAWIENKLVFSDETLENIGVLLERWYGVKVEFNDDEIRDYRFTGEFEKEELSILLGFLKESKNFNFELITGPVLIVKLSK